MSAHGTLCPTSPSLPWVAWASLPHIHRYSTTLRLPTVPLGGFACRSPSRYLACFQRSSWPSRARDQGEAPRARQGLWSPGPPCRVWDQETGGSPTFPSSPWEDMPRSQTPVVSCARALPHSGLLPASACTPSASHDSTPFGAPSRGLPSCSTRLRTAPCGEARGVAPDLLARCSSGGTCTRCAPTGKPQPISWSNLQSQGFGLPLARASFCAGMLIRI
jgi:hypothetical protein